MGLDAALRFRMLSRKAVFLDGFSMIGELFAGLPLWAALPLGLPLLPDFPFGAALTAVGRAGAKRAFLVAGLAARLGAIFLAGDLWFLAMGSFG